MKNGFININKAAGMTSHDAVNKIRRIFNTKKVGHGGTLDPFATGVLPVAIGKATRFIEYLFDSDKEYRAEIIFGVETDTGDITGKIVNSVNEIKIPSLEEVKGVLKELTGIIDQTPPKYSAIKINGRKAYELARKNINFEIPTRQVEIKRLQAVELAENVLTIEVECSKGTYIRSLAVDIGKRLNLPAVLRRLERTRAGNFFINKSLTIEELEERGESALISVESSLVKLKRFNLPEYRRQAFCNGLTTRINREFEEGELMRVYAAEEFIGVGKIVDGEIKAAKLFVN